MNSMKALLEGEKKLRSLARRIRGAKWEGWIELVTKINLVTLPCLDRIWLDFLDGPESTVRFDHITSLCRGYCELAIESLYTQSVRAKEDHLVLILSDSLPSDTTVENQVAALWRHCVRWSAMRYVSPSRKHWQMALPFLVASVQGSARNPTDQARVDLIAGLLLGAIDTHRMRRRHIMNVDMQTERLIFQRLGARANRKQSVVSAAGYRAFDSDQYLGIELDVGEHDSFDPTALIQSLPKEVVRDPNDWDRDTRSVPLPAEARLVLSYSDFGCLLSDNPRAQNPTTPGTADFGLEVFFAHGCRMLIDAELQVHRGTFDPRLKGYQMRHPAREDRS